MTAIETEPVGAEERLGASRMPAAARVTRAKRRTAWQMLRSVVFWTHVVMGVTGGVIIFVMSITGAILGFEKQIEAKIEGVAQAVPPSATATRLPLDSLFARDSVSMAGVASVVLKADRLEPVSIRFRDRNKPTQLLDPYSATVIPAVVRGKTTEFMGWIRGWHRWLGITGENRPLARTFTGAANFAFLLLVLSGLVIWWPKRLTPAGFKAATVFNPTLGGKARDFNWHNTLGFWSAIPLACVVASGVFMSYQWPAQWLDRMLGTEKEKAAAIVAMNTPPQREGAGREGGAGGRGAGGGNREGGERSAAPVRVLASLDVMLATAQQAHPEWQSITITPAGPRDTTVQMAVAEGNTYRPDLKTTYFFDPATGATQRTTNYDSLSTSRQIRAWYRFTHTGEMFGITGQAIATFVSVVGCMLVYTGLALALRRLAAFVRRRKRVAAAV